jgi:hypothetical protein
MRRILSAAIFALTALWAGGALAQAQGSAPPAPGRYAIVPAGDGFVRLDTQTGLVSQCERRDGQFMCQPALESSGEVFSTLAGFGQRLDAMKDEVSRLSSEAAALKAKVEEVDRTTLKLPEKLSPEEQAEVDRSSSVTDQMLRRLFTLVAAMKRAESK